MIILSKILQQNKKNDSMERFTIQVKNIQINSNTDVEILHEILGFKLRLQK